MLPCMFLLPYVSLKMALKSPGWGLWGMDQVWVRGSALPPSAACSGTLGCLPGSWQQVRAVCARVRQHVPVHCPGRWGSYPFLCFGNSASVVLPFSTTCTGTKCTFCTAPLSPPSQPFCPMLPVLPHAASDVLGSSTACTSTTHAWAQAHCM